MGLLFFLALGFLIYSNSRIAAAKGRNPAAWVLISIVAYFVSYGILATAYLGIVYKGPYTREAMMAYVEKNPMTGLLVVLLGFTGILAVRFYLERSASQKPEENEEEG